MPLILLLLLAGLSTRAALIVVTNAADTDNGSLRQALLFANTNPGPDTITFNIPGSGTRTLRLGSVLPALVDPVTLDGTTQPGYSRRPLIELNGAAAGANPGLRIVAGHCTVRGLAINGFGTDGLRIEAQGANIIQGNCIGADPTALAPRPNGQSGIFIIGSRSNLVGGMNPGEGNIISGNTGAGIFVFQGGDNVLQGNLVGTTSSGLGYLGNGMDASNHGVVLYDSGANLVGGPAAGAGNLLSGNGGAGLYLYGSGSTANVIQGNLIGTDATGSAMLSNRLDGITLAAAPANLIGGTQPGEGNVIAGNGQAGINVVGGSVGNVFQRNLIGSPISSVGNALAGLVFSGAGSNLVGGATPGSGNVISGNHQDGLLLTNTVGLVIRGNLIGTDATGNWPLPNAFNGISIHKANSNSVGGSAPGERNVISGNGYYGVHLALGASANSIQGNFIGLRASGDATLGNTAGGLRLESGGNLIGGRGTAGNVISGNNGNGIFVVGTAASSNFVQGNIIGLDSTGTHPVANAGAGIGLSDAAANLIGGIEPGTGNVVAGNAHSGIYLMGTSCVRNQVLGNKVGTDLLGTKPVGNLWEGIYLERSNSNSLGAALSGAGNLVCANFGRGIWLTNSSFNVISGNFIGTAANGAIPLGNAWHAIECDVGAINNLIGGPGAGNTIAFANGVFAGVRVRAGSRNNAIRANAIFSNGALGIDHSDAGVSQNDLCDADSGANLLQNFPVLTQAVSGHGTAVCGMLNSIAGQLYFLDFFCSPACDPAGYGEGQQFLGELPITTAADCSVSFVAHFALALPAGSVVTATATDPAGNTSEFSACTPVLSVPPLGFTRNGDGSIRLSWPQTASNFTLKRTLSLSPPVEWSPVPLTPERENGECIVRLPARGTAEFFTLMFE